MEKATSTIRRSGAFLLSFGTGHQELNLIISDLKTLKSQLKAVRDSQETILQDIINWTCADGNRTLQALFLHLSDLNALWKEVQTNFADDISEFKHHFERILGEERNVEALQQELNNSKVLEQKAKKKLEKAEKKQTNHKIMAAEKNMIESERHTKLLQDQVTQKIKENEAVKFIIIKGSLLKLSEAYLSLAQKCIYIFEAQRDMVKRLPDVDGEDINNLKFIHNFGANDILERARTLVKNHRIVNFTIANSPPSQPGNADPPPPYSLSPYYPNAPYNPHYLSSGEEYNATSSRNNNDRNQP